jgi:S1-C subfamily serine protease
MEIAERSPASVAGLRPHDLVLALNGVPVRSVDELLKALSSKDVLDRFVVTIARAGARIDLPVAPTVR